jgi:phage shock protein C
MNMYGKRFEVDRENGKVAGVCAGIANMTGVDATLIRVGLVLVTIVGAFPWTLVAYAIAALVGQPRRQHAYTPIVSRDREDARDRMRDIDVRMQAIETYVTSSNSKLAREIEELR